MSPAALFSAAQVTAPNLTVGQNLEAITSVTLTAPAPSGGLILKVTSSDPGRLLLSTREEALGSSEINLKVQEGRIGSPEFVVQALAASGIVTYTASAAGYEDGLGTVKLAPSGIVLSGPARFAKTLVTTSGGWPAKLTVYSALLDPSGKFVAFQQVRGGFTAKIRLTSSEASVAGIETDALTIGGGEVSAITLLKPLRAGSTVITVDVPPGFTSPAESKSVTANIQTPGMGVSEEVAIGRDLEVGSHLTLGEPAPGDGLKVTLASADPSKLLLSVASTDPGSKSIVLSIPGGASNINYFMHGMSDSGSVSYTASASGYKSVTGTVTLAPSGVILAGPTGAPDEAEILRPNAPIGVNGFFTKVTGGPVHFVAYMAQLDRVTRRGADITVQMLRSGLTLKVNLTNSDPSVGTSPSTVTVVGGSDQGGGVFTPLKEGSSVISVVTPRGFTTPSNATTLKAVVTN